MIETQENLQILQLMEKDFLLFRETMELVMDNTIQGMVIFM